MTTLTDYKFVNNFFVTVTDLVTVNNTAIHNDISVQDRDDILGILQYANTPNSVLRLTYQNILDKSIMEIMEASSPDGIAINLKRGLEGTVPLNITSGEIIEARLSAGLILDMVNASDVNNIHTNQNSDILVNSYGDILN